DHARNAAVLVDHESNVFEAIKHPLEKLMQRQRIRYDQNISLEVPKRDIMFLLCGFQEDVVFENVSSDVVARFRIDGDSREPKLVFLFDHLTHGLGFWESKQHDARSHDVLG